MRMTMMMFGLCAVYVLGASEHSQKSILPDAYPRIVPFVGMPFGAIMVPKLSDSNMNCHTFVIGSGEAPHDSLVSFFAVCYKGNNEVPVLTKKTGARQPMQLPLRPLVKNGGFGQCKVDSAVVSLIAKTLQKPIEELSGACIDDPLASASFIRYLCQRRLMADDGVRLVPEAKMPFCLIATDNGFQQRLLDNVRKTRVYKGDVEGDKGNQVVLKDLLDGQQIAISSQFNASTKPILCADADPEDEEFSVCLSGKCLADQSVNDCRAALSYQMMLLRDKKR